MGSSSQIVPPALVVEPAEKLELVAEVEPEPVQEESPKGKALEEYYTDGGVSGSASRAATVVEWTIIGDPTKRGSNRRPLVLTDSASVEREFLARQVGSPTADGVMVMFQSMTAELAPGASPLPSVLAVFEAASRPLSLPVERVMYFDMHDWLSIVKRFNVDQGFRLLAGDAGDHAVRLWQQKHRSHLHPRSVTKLGTGAGGETKEFQVFVYETKDFDVMEQAFGIVTGRKRDMGYDRPGDAGGMDVCSEDDEEDEEDSESEVLSRSLSEASIGDVGAAGAGAAGADAAGNPPADRLDALRLSRRRSTRFDGPFGMMRRRKEDEFTTRIIPDRIGMLRTLLMQQAMDKSAEDDDVDGAFDFVGAVGDIIAAAAAPATYHSGALGGAGSYPLALDHGDYGVADPRASGVSHQRAPTAGGSVVDSLGLDMLAAAHLDSRNVLPLLTHCGMVHGLSDIRGLKLIERVYADAIADIITSSADSKIDAWRTSQVFVTEGAMFVPREASAGGAGWSDTAAPLDLRLPPELFLGSRALAPAAAVSPHSPHGAGAPAAVALPLPPVQMAAVAKPVKGRARKAAAQRKRAAAAAAANGLGGGGGSPVGALAASPSSHSESLIMAPGHTGVDSSSHGVVGAAMFAAAAAQAADRRGGGPTGSAVPPLSHHTRGDLLHGVVPPFARTESNATHASVPLQRAHSNATQGSSSHGQVGVGSGIGRGLGALHTSIHVPVSASSPPFPGSPIGTLTSPPHGSMRIESDTNAPAGGSVSHRRGRGVQSTHGGSVSPGYPRPSSADLSLGSPHGSAAHIVRGTGAAMPPPPADAVGMRPAPGTDPHSPLSLASHAVGGSVTSVIHTDAAIAGDTVVPVVPADAVLVRDSVGSHPGGSVSPADAVAPTNSSSTGSPSAALPFTTAGSGVGPAFGGGRAVGSMRSLRSNASPSPPGRTAVHPLSGSGSPNGPHAPASVSGTWTPFSPLGAAAFSAARASSGVGLVTATGARAIASQGSGWAHGIAAGSHSPTHHDGGGAEQRFSTSDQAATSRDGGNLQPLGPIPIWRLMTLATAAGVPPRGPPLFVVCAVFAKGLGSTKAVASAVTAAHRFNASAMRASRAFAARQSGVWVTGPWDGQLDVTTIGHPRWGPSPLGEGGPVVRYSADEPVFSPPVAAQSPHHGPRGGHSDGAHLSPGRVSVGSPRGTDDLNRDKPAAAVSADVGVGSVAWHSKDVDASVFLDGEALSARLCVHVAALVGREETEWVPAYITLQRLWRRILAQRVRRRRGRVPVAEAIPTDGIRVLRAVLGGDPEDEPISTTFVDSDGFSWSLSRVRPEWFGFDRQAYVDAPQQPPMDITIGKVNMKYRSGRRRAGKVKGERVVMSNVIGQALAAKPPDPYVFSVAMVGAECDLRANEMDSLLMLHMKQMRARRLDRLKERRTAKQDENDEGPLTLSRMVQHMSPMEVNDLIHALSTRRKPHGTGGVAYGMFLPKMVGLARTTDPPRVSAKAKLRDLSPDSSAGQRAGDASPRSPRDGGGGWTTGPKRPRSQSPSSVWRSGTGQSVRGGGASSGKATPAARPAQGSAAGPAGPWSAPRAGHSRMMAAAVFPQSSPYITAQRAQQQLQQQMMRYNTYANDDDDDREARDVDDDGDESLISQSRPGTRGGTAGAPRASVSTRSASAMSARPAGAAAQQWPPTALATAARLAPLVSLRQGVVTALFSPAVLPRTDHRAATTSSAAVPPAPPGNSNAGGSGGDRPRGRLAPLPRAADGSGSGTADRRPTASADSRAAPTAGKPCADAPDGAGDGHVEWAHAAVVRDGNHTDSVPNDVYAKDVWRRVDQFIVNPDRILRDVLYTADPALSAFFYADSPNARATSAAAALLPGAATTDPKASTPPVRSPTAQSAAAYGPAEGFSDAIATPRSVAATGRPSPLASPRPLPAPGPNSDVKDGKAADKDTEGPPSPRALPHMPPTPNRATQPTTPPSTAALITSPFTPGPAPPRGGLGMSLNKKHDLPGGAADASIPLSPFQRARAQQQLLQQQQQPQKVPPSSPAKPAPGATDVAVYIPANHTIPPRPPSQLLARARRTHQAATSPTSAGDANGVCSPGATAAASEWFAVDGDVTSAGQHAAARVGHTAPAATVVRVAPAVGAGGPATGGPGFTLASARRGPTPQTGGRAVATSPTRAVALAPPTAAEVEAKKAAILESQRRLATSPPAKVNISTYATGIVSRQINHDRPHGSLLEKGASISIIDPSEYASYGRQASPGRGRDPSPAKNARKASPR